MDEQAVFPAHPHWFVRFEDGEGRMFTYSIVGWVKLTDQDWFNPIFVGPANDVTWAYWEIDPSWVIDDIFFSPPS